LEDYSAGEEDDGDRGEDGSSCHCGWIIGRLALPMGTCGQTVS
jgi:hypothetical protein